MAIGVAPVNVAAQEIPPNTPGASPQVRPSEIKGTVRLNGWIGDASQIKVYAVPGSVVPPGGRRPAPDPRATERSAALTPMGGSNEFAFSIMGLHPSTTYRLGIELPPAPAQPKVFWRGLMGGMAVSGAPPVAIEGFVARTEVEIRDVQGNWVGADELRFDDPATPLRTLRWRTSIRGAVAGELQVSTRAFPIKGDFGSCDEPARGLVYREQFSVRPGEWQEIGALDFGRILQPGRTLPPRDARVAATDVSAISQNELRLLALGAPLYVRVVPVTASRRACNIREDGVHGWVILAKLQKPDFSPVTPPSVTPNIEPQSQLYSPPQFPESESERHPNMGGDSAYYVIKDHKLPPCRSWEYGNKLCPKWPGASWKYSELTKDWYLVDQYDPLGQILVDSGSESLKPNTVLYKGTKFYYVIWVTKTSSCSGFCLVGEVFTGLVTAAWNGFGNFVSYVAEGYESIQEGVAEVVAEVVTVLPVIGDACNALVSCQDVIRMGITYGLASMGLPPSLPNWNELKQQGMDYLAAEIATEMASATGLPEEVTKLGADETMNLAKNMALKAIDAMSRNQGSGNGPQYDWVLPYSGIDPAVWNIWVRKKPGIELPSSLYLRTRGFATFYDPFTNANPFIDTLYVPGEIHVPTEFPSSGVIRVPIVLQPDYSTIPPPKCYQTPGYSVYCSPNPNFLNVALCLTSDGINPFKPVDCKSWSNYIGVYYRDYWIERRLATSNGCVYLKARADIRKSSPTDFFKQLTDPTFDPWVPYAPPFHDFAAIKAKKPAFWVEPFFVGPGCS